VGCLTTQIEELAALSPEEKSFSGLGQACVRFPLSSFGCRHVMGRRDHDCEFCTSAALDRDAQWSSLVCLAIIESGESQAASARAHLMALFVLLAAESYLWSLVSEGTVTQTVTYIQLFMMVWLIWQLASRGRRTDATCMQAYVLGDIRLMTPSTYLLFTRSPFINGTPARGLDANDLGLLMAFEHSFSYYLLIQSKGMIAWVYRLQLALAGNDSLLLPQRAALASVFALAIVP